MFKSANPMRVFCLVAYLLAILFAGLPVAGPSGQSASGHARMMSMAGHAAAMDMMDDSQSDEAQKRLCEQHCRVATASLPLAELPGVRPAHPSPVLPEPAPFAASLILPPPGPPPKAAQI